MPQTATINPDMTDMVGLHHIINQSIIEPEDEFYDPTPEEEEKIRRAEAEHSRGEYYTKFPGESFEEFFARIDADPEKWLECNLHKEKFL